MFSELQDNSHFFTQAPSLDSTVSTVLASGPETTDSFSSMLENTQSFQDQLPMPVGTPISSASSPEMQRRSSAQLAPATPAARPLQPKSSPGQPWPSNFSPYDVTQDQNIMGPPQQHLMHPDTPISQSLPFVANPFHFSQQSPYPSGSGQMQPGFGSNGFHPGIHFGMGQQGLFQPTTTLNGGMTASWNYQPNQLSHSFSGPSSSSTGATVKGFPQLSKQQMQFQQQQEEMLQQQQRQAAAQDEAAKVKTEQESWGGQQKQQLQEHRAKDSKSLQPIQPAPTAPKGTTAFEDMIEVNRLAFVRGMCWAREQAIRKIKEQLAQSGTVFGSASAEQLATRTSLEAELQVWFANGGNAVDASAAAARHIADMFANKHPRVHAVLKTTAGFTKPTAPPSLPTVMQRVSDIPKSQIYTFKPPQTGAGKGAPQPVPGENEKPKKADADSTFRLVTSFERTIDGHDTIFHYCSDGEIRILNDEDFKAAKERTEAWNKMMEPVARAALGKQGSGIGAATAYVPTTQADGVIKLTASNRKRKASTSEPSISPPKKKRAPRKKPLETVPEEEVVPSTANDASQTVTTTDWVVSW